MAEPVAVVPPVFDWVELVTVVLTSSAPWMPEFCSALPTTDFM